MRIFLIFLLLFSVNTVVAEDSASGQSKECVILLHGLGDIKLSMLKLEKALQKEGYETINIGYTTAGKTIEKVAEDKLAKIVTNCKKQNFKKIHFVTHSMGGLIVRYYLQTVSIPDSSRIVMLSPPNHGSEIADFFAKSPIYKFFVGEVGQELTTDSELLAKLKAITPEIGIIAGNKSSNPYFSKIIPGEDDGRVAVGKTKLAEMDDFLIVPSTHLTIKYNNSVTDQIKKFLKDGKFDHSQK